MTHPDLHEQMRLQEERIRSAQHEVSKQFTTAEIIEVINAKKNRARAASPPALSSRRGSFGGLPLSSFKRQVA